MQDFKIIFVHGFTASSKSDWYPRISSELKKLHIEFAVPDMLNSSHPHAAEWLDTLHTEVIKSKKPIVLVGHSLGTRTVLLYLEKFMPKNCKLALLVAAFANKTENAKRWDGGAYPDFFEHENVNPYIRNAQITYIYYLNTNDYSLIIRNNNFLNNNSRAALFDSRLPEAKEYGRKGIDFFDVDIVSNCNGTFSITNPPPFSGPWNEIR